MINHQDTIYSFATSDIDTACLQQHMLLTEYTFFILLLLKKKNDLHNGTSLFSVNIMILSRSPCYGATTISC